MSLAARSGVLSNGKRCSAIASGVQKSQAVASSTHSDGCPGVPARQSAPVSWCTGSDVLGSGERCPWPVLMGLRVRQHRCAAFDFASAMFCRPALIAEYLFSVLVFPSNIWLYIFAHWSSARPAWLSFIHLELFFLSQSKRISTISADIRMMEFVVPCRVLRVAFSI